MTQDPNLTLVSVIIAIVGTLVGTVIGVLSFQNRQKADLKLDVVSNMTLKNDINLIKQQVSFFSNRLDQFEHQLDRIQQFQWGTDSHSPEPAYMRGKDEPDPKNKGTGIFKEGDYP